MSYVILSDQFWGEDLVGWFPCVIRCGITLPLNQVLKSPLFTKVTVIYDFLDFELLEVVHEVWGRPCEVVPVLWSFTIRGQQGGVEHVMRSESVV